MSYIYIYIYDIISLRVNISTLQKEAPCYSAASVRICHSIWHYKPIINFISYDT